MRNLMKEHGAEALIGLFVVLVAVWFAYTSWQRTGGGRVSHAMQVTALFPSASGVSVGTDVRVAGIPAAESYEDNLAIYQGVVKAFRDALH